MIKGLKIVLIIFGVVEILLGLMMIVAPEQAADMAGISDVSDYLRYTMASLGVCLIAPSVFLIVAAGDPLRHINWVKFAILWCILGVAAGLYAFFQGFVTFEQAGMQIIMDAVFAVAFLALYPYGKAKSS